MIKATCADIIDYQGLSDTPVETNNSANPSCWGYLKLHETDSFYVEPYRYVDCIPKENAYRFDKCDDEYMTEPVQKRTLIDGTIVHE